jgi:predicted nucleic acid-binding protein
MNVFFDTSAVVPLVLNETHSEASKAVWEKTATAWAWEWMRVEGEAALIRRVTTAPSWNMWRVVLGEFRLLGLTSTLHVSLCAFNRGVGLRAADAAHLFVFDRLLAHVPDARLLTFDEEMATAAGSLGLPLHPACP